MKHCEWHLIRHSGIFMTATFIGSQSRTYGHHEAKYTAAKLIFGQRYEDADLLNDGYESLRHYARTRHFQRDVGVRRIALVLALGAGFTCAWQLSQDTEIRSELARMLDIYGTNVRRTI